MSTANTKPDPVLSVRDLHAGYGGRAILKGVSLEVQPGEIRVLLGGSGCGKSTMLRNILGLETPWSGTIRVLGSEGPIVHSRIGVLFQNGALVTSLTVGQNVMLPLVLDGIAPKGAAEEVARARLAQVRMGHAWGLFPGELSGGMRKRAALARALVREPQILFCDEPSAGLDPLTSRELDELLLELRESLGLSIVLVTHELDSIRTLAQRILYLHQGVALFDGTLDEALDHGPDRVKDFFARRTDPANAIPTTSWEILP
ncbi:MAG: ATP-binding cassette domain-containing protein [Fibrobacterota bacterium]|nr:ATP-binding cassette domain-containing protein [Fibrobacterota bacterium]QQS04617.1 MAG: ATP-binding cassette domain-containing protein [Fibrobacterota bacterium]